jgi:hypothetical protein
MRITRLNGIDITSDAQAFPDKVEILCVANGAIDVGKVVKIDVTDATGYKVIAAALAAGNLQLAQGIYEGIGGRGTAAGTGYRGNAALTGDSIFVTAYGKATATVEGLASSNAGQRCTVSAATGAGNLKVIANEATATDDKYSVPFVILEQYQTTTAAAKAVFVRCL